MKERWGKEKRKLSEKRIDDDRQKMGDIKKSFGQIAGGVGFPRSTVASALGSALGLTLGLGSSCLSLVDLSEK